MVAFAMIKGANMMTTARRAASTPLFVVIVIALSCAACGGEGSGTSPAGSGGSSGPNPTAPATTAEVVCGLSRVVLNPTLGVTSQANWTCANGSRTLTANGIPDHAVGVFPNPENPNAISAQAVQFTATLTPTASTPQMVTPGAWVTISMASSLIR